MCVLVTQSCLTLCDRMDYSPAGSSVHGILQTRILEWVAILLQRSSRPRDEIQASCTIGWFFTVWATRGIHLFTCFKVKIKWVPFQKKKKIKLIWNSRKIWNAYSVNFSLHTSHIGSPEQRKDIKDPSWIKWNQLFLSWCLVAVGFYQPLTWRELIYEKNWPFF